MPQRMQLLKVLKIYFTYNIKYKLEEIFLVYIIHDIPREKEAESTIILFKLVDENEDGKLKKNELKNTL